MKSPGKAKMHQLSHAWNIIGIYVQFFSADYLTVLVSVGSTKTLLTCLVKTKAPHHATHYQVCPRNYCHIYGIHSSVSSTKTIRYDIREQRYKEMKIENKILKIPYVGQS